MESREKARERSKLWYQANRERHLEYDKKYYLANKKKFYKQHKKYMRKYYLANREKLLQKNKEYYKIHSKPKRKLVPQDWITTRQICQLLNISRERVRQLRSENKITYLELSPHIFIYSKNEILKRKRRISHV